MPKITTSQRNRFSQIAANKLTQPILFATGLLLLLIAGWLWWSKVYTNPYNVFWGMMDKNLSTSSITRHIIEEDPSGSMEQVIRMNLGSENVAHNRTTITQPETSIANETISTIDSTYLRYTDIKTDQKSRSGKDLDFASIVNVWGKTDNEAGAQSGFEEIYLPIDSVPRIPFANLPKADRNQLLKLIREKDVFKTSYKQAKRETQNGRAVYVYDVSLKADAYIEMLHEFTKMTNLPPMDGLDPADYKDYPPIVIQMKVDLLSHQLVEVVYESSKRQERISGYGITKPIEIPAATIKTEEIQNKIQTLVQE